YHSYDVIQVPREVYNLDGGRSNSISVMEAIDRVETMTEYKMRWEYREEPRKGDQIFYITDLRKFSSHYPNQKPSRNLDAIFEEMIAAESRRHVSQSFSRNAIRSWTLAVDQNPSMPTTRGRKGRLGRRGVATQLQAGRRPVESALD